MSKNINMIFFRLLRSAIDSHPLTDEERAEYSTEQFSDFLSIAKKHDVAHLLILGLKKNGMLAGESAAYEKLILKTALRHERQHYEYKKICSALDEEEIPFIPLKGSVIRKYYPEPWMRTSCDIDVLVHKEDIDRSVNKLTAIGYHIYKDNYHDVSLLSESNVLLELHFSICENIKSMDAVLKDVWNYAKPTENSMCELDWKFFIFHIYAHAAYHFSSGGCGIRTLLDIHILKTKLNLSYTLAEDLLQKANLLSFAKKIEKLADICMIGGEIDEFSNVLLDYIVSGGSYGSFVNRIAVIKKRSKNNTFIFALKRLFLPYKTMKTAYPILKKLPFLLPFCWVVRLFKALIAGKTKKAVAELSTANNLSDSKLAEIEQIFDTLEL